MERREFLGVLGGATALPLAAPTQQATLPPIGSTAEEAKSIAQDTYIYLYPLVLMAVSRKHFTNIEPDKMFGPGPKDVAQDRSLGCSQPARCQSRVIELRQAPAGLAKLNATALAVLRLVPPCRVRGGLQPFLIPPSSEAP
jgi:hypothetical protein